MTWRTSPNSATLASAIGPIDRWCSSPLIRAVPDISFSIQNCNSLNISTHCDKQLAKLIAITALCTDIIFLCDLRLHDDTDAIEKITKIFQCNKNHNYNFHFNSSSRNRGVGILIACDFVGNIANTFHDSCSNILGLVITTDSCIFSLCSVYGPNTNDESFYNSLSSYIDTLGDAPVVIGGDWNATYSQAQSCNNLDVINMVSPRASLGQVG
jgi:exonuclease III